MKLNHCPECGSVWTTEEIEDQECGACDWPTTSNDDDSDNDFQPCDNCDLPDACEDFGCAIKAGIRQDPTVY